MISFAERVEATTLKRLVATVSDRQRNRTVVKPPFAKLLPNARLSPNARSQQAINTNDRFFVGLKASLAYSFDWRGGQAWQIREFKADRGIAAAICD
jgi:hypothetical protein